MTNMSRWKIDGPNRNRWFTVLNSMVDFPWQTVNVITRWLYSYGGFYHVMGDPQVKKVKRFQSSLVVMVSRMTIGSGGPTP